MKTHYRGGFLSPMAVALVFIVALVGGYYYFNSKYGPVDDINTNDQTVSDVSVPVIAPSDVSVGARDLPAVQYSGNLLAGKASPLLDYNKSDFDSALTSGKLIVLYFYANWCPICRAEFPVMQQAFNELSTEGAIGFRVNFNDNETDSNEESLAKQFGVVYQHTKVFVRNGQSVLKSPQTWNKNRYLSEINKYLNQ